MAFRVKDAAAAYKRAVKLGAWGVEQHVGPMELNIPAIKGIGDSLIYLVDRYGDRGTIYDVDFMPLPGAERNPAGCGLTYIDHLTHTVHRSEEHTSELQSLMRTSYAAFYSKQQITKH